MVFKASEVIQKVADKFYTYQLLLETDRNRCVAHFRLIVLVQ